MLRRILAIILLLFATVLLRGSCLTGDLRFPCGHPRPHKHNFQWVSLLSM